MEADPRESIESLLPESLARCACAGSPLRWPWPAGLALRLWMLKQFFLVNGDPLIYGDLAKNLLLHGSYALRPGAAECCIRR